MSTRRPGAPAWVDLMTLDAGRARTFYSALFGWQMRTRTDRLGTYTFASTASGRDVAGIVADQPTSLAHYPNQWTVFLHCEDLDDTLARVTADGGTPILEPTMLGDAPACEGALALFTCPAGAITGLWEPGTRHELELTNEHGAVSWVEFASTDLDATLRFYRDALDMEITAVPGAEARYHVLGGIDDSEIGFCDDSVLADGAPARWRVYFSVDDVDAAAATAVRLGGLVVAEPVDSPTGRVATLADDQGARFRVTGP